MTALLAMLALLAAPPAVRAQSDAACLEYGALGMEPRLCDEDAPDEARERCDTYLSKTFVACIGATARAYSDFHAVADPSSQEAAKRRFNMAMGEMKRMLRLETRPGTRDWARDRLKRVREAMPSLEMNRREIYKALGQEMEPLVPTAPKAPQPAEPAGSRSSLDAMGRLSSREESSEPPAAQAPAVKAPPAEPTPPVEKKLPVVETPVARPSALPAAEEPQAELEPEPVEEPAAAAPAAPVVELSAAPAPAPRAARKAGGTARSVGLLVFAGVLALLIYRRARR